MRISSTSDTLQQAAAPSCHFGALNAACLRRGRKKEEVSSLVHPAPFRSITRSSPQHMVLDKLGHGSLDAAPDVELSRSPGRLEPLQSPPPLPTTEVPPSLSAEAQLKTNRPALPALPASRSVRQSRCSRASEGRKPKGGDQVQQALLASSAAPPPEVAKEVAEEVEDAEKAVAVGAAPTPAEEGRQPAPSERHVNDEERLVAQQMRLSLDSSPVSPREPQAGPAEEGAGGAQEGQDGVEDSRDEECAAGTFPCEAEDAGSRPETSASDAMSNLGFGIETKWDPAYIRPTPATCAPS
ncbi:hypothetical protein CYMTET_34515 [Cymbomonas tetramitiformis]|uniref:Uncharacterized protein n=1 Tax=Cymbomonas tetramitiformis TaxID=36881 RepID=A0AAE0FAW3_9CHLO|nr:hypothetical protein CYMTET_34515 [Cymbomonas tetramitiformis]